MISMTVNYEVLFLEQGLNGLYDKVHYKVLFLGQGLMISMTKSTTKSCF